ncbi:hypothetical protein, partial [Paenibacillus sp.]|uniref:hypothetical protein n=1 Tax=Paenibacillus sp. TaxID=58172 RepID=UPI0028288182
MRKNVIRDRNNPLNIEVQSIQKALEQVEFLREDQLGLLEGINNELSSLELKYQESEQEVHRLNEEIAICNIELAKHDLLFATEYKARQKRFKEIVESPLTPEAREIARVIQRHEFKGIVVYPHAVHWEPLQRPQHLLMEFARKGYLCFFCDYSESFYINEIEERMFVVSNQDHLLQVLQTYHVLVINSYLLQNAWIEELPHKTIWYDVLDRVDFFSLYDRNMLAKHYQVLHDADIVTYSAVKLNEYVKDRDDAIYLPNAVRPGDFIVTEDVKLAIPDDLKPILKRKKRIIGYFGAIEEWFDTELVRKMARDPQVIIVLIGHCGISKENFPKNVYFLGMKPYSQLKNYAVHFDALMIPFIVNSLTNAVSPVKFFEYCSLGKPIITTPIAEVLSYQGPGITYVDTEHFDGFHRKLWDLSNEAKAHLQKLSDDNQWGKRALQIESELESRQSCLKLFANRSFSNHVSVFAATFLDYEGENY